MNAAQLKIGILCIMHKSKTKICAKRQRRRPVAPGRKSGYNKAKGGRPARERGRGKGRGAMSKGQEARRLFLEGYNCAQSVTGAFAGEMGLSLEQAVRMASALGGGIGRLRETCGAVVAMGLVYGVLRGYSTPGTHEEKTATYAAMQRMGARFKERAGTFSCRELLGEEGAQPLTAQARARTADYYASRPCPGLVALAADILARELAAGPAGQP